jgi:glycosyltransferase involved in cell wall biosynthesis
MSTISVVLVVRNGAATIRQALDSVFRSVRKPSEIVLVDGRSNDATVEIAMTYPHVRVIDDGGLGIAHAYNLGIGAVTGDLICFISHDDIWCDGKLDIQTPVMEADPSLLYSTGQVVHFLDGEVTPPGFRTELLDTAAPGVIPETLMARPEAFARVGLMDETLKGGEDTDWFARARDLGLKSAALPDVLARKRVHGSNTSLNNGQLTGSLLHILRASVERKRGGSPP